MKTALIAMWRKAEGMADSTPEDRNRYVDFLRAFSIGAVVLGHWLIAAPSYQNATPAMDHVLSIQPWSQWITWLFQVMPVFFFVGGFSNGVSWDGAQNKGQSYAHWLEARLRRLLGPVVPLILLWTILAIVGHSLAVPTPMITIGSQVSLVPVWFLAIYFIIVMLVPVSRSLWRKFGWWSVSIPMTLAAFGDWVYFNTSNTWYPWFNYLFLWSAVHQLGYVWQQGRMPSARILFAVGVASLAALVTMTVFGPYPLSLVGHPEQVISNTTPPKLPLIALGLTQIGLLLAFEKPMRSWLAKAKVWTSTVLINGLIMPIFLWHSTVMILVIGACFWLMPELLSTEVSSNAWWWLRPVWIVAYLIVLFVFLPVFIRLESMMSGQPKGRSYVPIVMPAGLCFCAGLALLAGQGVAGPAWMGLNLIAIMLPAAAVLILSGVGRLFR